MTWRIEPAAVADCAALPAIERDASGRFAQFAHLAWIADAEVRDAGAWADIVTQGRALAAREGEAIVGFLAATRHGDFVHVEELSVVRAAQGRGIGRALLRRAIAAARAEGSAGLTLTTFHAVP